MPATTIRPFVESGTEIAVLKGHDETVNSAVFSGDGKRVVTTSRDDTARIWDGALDISERAMGSRVVDYRRRAKACAPGHAIAT